MGDFSNPIKDKDEMENKYLALVILILVLPLISAFSPQLIDPCFADKQISSPCFTSNLNIFYFGIDSTFPTITLISPEDGTMKDTGVIRFIFNPTDNNNLINCSLVYQDGIYTTITPTKNQNNIIEVVGVDNQHPLYNDDLQWRIDCTDQFNNVGSSETRNLDTRTEPGGGFVGVRKKNPKFINILSDEFWTRGENKVIIEAFNQNDNLFIPENITFEIINNEINLTKQEVINETTIVIFTIAENMSNGVYSITLNVTEERTIIEDIEFTLVNEVKQIIVDRENFFKRFWILILIIAVILITVIIVILILIDKKRKKR